MELLLLPAGLIFLLSSSTVVLISAVDTLERGFSVSINQTIISTGGIFALGFFFPSNSSRRCYAGIWYNNIPEKTIVWVANREKPLVDPSGALAIAGDGNVAVLDGKGGVLWSSNVSGISGNTTAVLLDSGNLVLKGDAGGGTIWQSFDHPADTLLPGMKLVSSFDSDVSSRLTSWRDPEDPAPGEFSFGIDPRFSLQTTVQRGSEIYMRGQVWNGNLLSWTRDDNNTLSVYVTSVQVDGKGFNLTSAATAGSAAAQNMLDSTGSFKGTVWNDRMENWAIVSLFPERPCDIYNSCGPSAICDDSNPTLNCSCLRGYEPKSRGEWDRGNFSGGCAKRVAFTCDGGDGFLGVGGLKLPDEFRSMWNMSSTQQCEAECLKRCDCTAYAYANVSSSVALGSRCLHWFGEMLDITLLKAGGEDLLVRFAASELGPSSQIHHSSNKGTWLLITLPTVGVAIFLIGMFCFLRWRTRKRGNRGAFNVLMLGEMDMSSAVQSGKDIIDLQVLDISSVIAATDNFSTVNKLGEGGFGPVYKGRLPQGQDIAVKRLSKNSGQGFEEFKNEVELIAKLQHANLVKLLAWCIHKNEKILIYEYLPNRSLDKFIFDPVHSVELDWANRTRIIEGIAQGLLYLHRYSRLRIIHRDLKTSNILLDDAMNPKISDFGLARIFGREQTEANTKKVVGTIGYMSPEYALNGIFSEKSDVFSFGVIILEIITGKRSTGFYLYDESLTLLGYAWRMWKEGKGLELVDSSVRGMVCELEALRFIQVGLLCIQENAMDRPTMSLVISMMDNEHTTLPSPKHPAFAVGSDLNLIEGSLSPGNKSINEVTLSTVKGR